MQLCSTELIVPFLHVSLLSTTTLQKMPTIQVSVIFLINIISVYVDFIWASLSFFSGQSSWAFSTFCNIWSNWSRLTSKVDCLIYFVNDPYQLTVLEQADLKAEVWMFYLFTVIGTFVFNLIVMFSYYSYGETVKNRLRWLVATKHIWSLMKYEKWLKMSIQLEW